MRYRFDDVVVDVDRRELRRGTVLATVEPQVFDVLVHLIRNRDRVVSKDELLAAVWGGRIVSESALFNRISAVRVVIGDTGTEQRLIRTLPRKGVRFVGAVQEQADAPAAAGRAAMAAHPPLPDRPSIAVLPFQDMSGEPDQEHIADGISEDLITALARIRWLFVIARNSSFAYKNRVVDVREVARELGVRYVLEGSVRRAGKRLRITAQLVDAASGGHHWAERYDRELGEIFAVQDEITESVAAAIAPNLLAAEGVRALARSADDLGAWELVARAQAHVWRLTRADYEAAIRGLDRAVKLHPDYAPAHGLLGFCLVFAVHMGWLKRERGLATGQLHAARAVALDDRDAWGHVALGYSALMERRTAEAIAAFRRAVTLTPSSAAAHSHLARAYAFAGRDREAIAHGEEAIRMSPVDPEMALFLGAIAVAHYTAGRHAEAAAFTAQALRLRPGFQGAQRLHCASLAQAGRIGEARSFLCTVLTEQPRLSLAWIRANVPYQTPELMERFLEGMRKAGLDDR
mgnify:CR=1 FL=1